MGKFKQKRVKHNQEALDVLAEKYKVSHDFIRKSIRGDRTGVLSKIIKEEYDLMVIASRASILSISSSKGLKSLFLTKKD